MPPADPPPAQLRAEMALVSMALVLGCDAPPAVWALRPADFWDPRHAALWAIAQAKRWRGGRYTDTQAEYDAAICAVLGDTAKSPPLRWVDQQRQSAASLYLASLIVMDWPGDVDRLVARVRSAALTRRMLDAANQMAYAWADDDRARWQGEIAALADAARSL